MDNVSESPALANKLINMGAIETMIEMFKSGNAKDSTTQKGLEFISKLTGKRLNYTQKM